MRTRALLAALVLLVCAAACSQTPATAASPSAAAKLVCSDEAAGDIHEALGVTTTSAPQPTWADGVYTCPYVYASGKLVITVKDLPDADTSAAYFTTQQAATTGAQTLPGVGQAAFAAPDGSATVRMDKQVMRVDVTGLPETFGVPAHPRAVDAITVANVILDCWTEG